MVALTTQSIDPSGIISSIATPAAGALDVFVGVVRNHSEGKRVRRLEYTAYIPMAERLMQKIEEEVKQRHVVHNVALVHRLGMLEVGEIAVVVAVSAAHRKEAFEACRFAIDRVKAIVPIWKKEHYEEGLAWVVGQHDIEVGGT